MIKLSKLTDYAVVVLVAMAQDESGPLAASHLAVKTGLPEPTVAKVLKLLVKDGIIVSTRGVKGGYLLETPAHELTIQRVITAIEGPIALTSCVKGSHESCTMERICVLNGRWNVVNAAINTALENVTLADMVPVSSKTKADTRTDEARL